MNSLIRKIDFIAGSLGQGGAERQLYYILNSLVSLGVSCRVLSLTRGEFYESRIRDLGVPVVWVGRSPFPPIRLITIARLTSSWRPDLVQSAHTFTNIYAANGGRWANCPSIGAVRTDGAKEFVTYRNFAKQTIKLPTALVANSVQAAEAVYSFGIPMDRIFVLPNAVDTSLFFPKTRTRIHSQQNRILNVGRLYPQKRHDIFLATIHRVVEKSPNTRGIIVGDGPLRNDLEVLCNELSLRDRIHFAGHQSEVSSFYADADTFLMTSDYEGTPNVVLEAMSSGLPVVATRAGGTSDVIQHGVTGFLCDVGDIEGLTHYITLLANDPELRRCIGLAAREYVCEVHGFEKLAANLTQIYGEILESHPDR